MVTATELNYKQVPELNLYVATTKALTDGRPIVDITWYAAKQWVQERGLVIPTSKEWSAARAYFEKNHLDIERDMISGPAEWTDSLIAWPNKDGSYSPQLNPKVKQGKVPVLIEGSFVDTRNGNYLIDGGERVELPTFPKSDGRLRNHIPELGLIEDAYIWSNSDFNYCEGLRPVFRGDWGLGPRVGRFGAVANGGPSVSSAGLGFRPARRGLIENGNETDFVKIPREEAEVLYKTLGKLLGKQ